MITNQVISSHGNPQMRRTVFEGYLFKYCSVKYKAFHQVSEKTSKQTDSHQKNHMKSFPDAPKSHKTSTNLSDRAYFRQFSDWWERHFGHSQESPEMKPYHVWSSIFLIGDLNMRLWTVTWKMKAIEFSSQYFTCIGMCGGCCRGLETATVVFMMIIKTMLIKQSWLFSCREECLDGGRWQGNETNPIVCHCFF